MCKCIGIPGTMISKELAADWRSCPFSSLPTCTRPTADVECFNGRKIFARGLQSPYTELSVHQTRIKSQYTHVHNLRIQHRLYAEHADRPYKTDTSSSRCSRIGGSHIKELERRGRGENWKKSVVRHHMHPHRRPFEWLYNIVGLSVMP